MDNTGIDPLNCSPTEYLQYLKAQTSAPPPSESQLKEEADRQAEIRQKLVEGLGEESVAEQEKARPDAAAAPPAAQLDALMVAHARELLEVNPLEIKQDFALGSLPTRELNAITIQVPAGGSLIVVDRDCFLLIFLLAKAVSSFFPEVEESDGSRGVGWIRDEKHLREQVESNPAGLMRFADAIFAYHFVRNVQYAQKYLQEGPQRGMADLLTDIAEKFIVANELMHISIFEPSHSERPVEERRLGSQTTVSQIARTREDEMASDLTALRLIQVYRQHQKADIELGYLGIEFLLSCLEIVEQIEGDRSVGSYPPAAHRRETMRRYVHDHFPEHAQAMTGMSNVMRDLVAAIWEGCRVQYVYLAARYEITGQAGDYPMDPWELPPTEPGS